MRDELANIESKLKELGYMRVMFAQRGTDEMTNELRLQLNRGITRLKKARTRLRNRLSRIDS